MEKQPFVSIIIPVRNEVSSIRRTIDSVLSQDYDASSFEILIADGASDDGTDRIIKEYAKNKSNIKYIENPKRIVPTGLNLAIQTTRAEIIVRMDAHSFYPENYISTLVKALFQYNADNVGCIIKTIPDSDNMKAKAIAMGLSSPYGVGNSMFRVGVEKAMEVDTVPFGCFRKEVFDHIGLFDEELARNQDDEFNARMLKNGYKIILIPELECSYLARSNFQQLSRMLYQYGVYKPLVNYKLKQVATLRQLVPLLLVLYLLGGILLCLVFPFLWILFSAGLSVYVLFIMTGALAGSIKTKEWVLFPLGVITFPVMHLSYGWGYINGILRLMRRSKENVFEVKLSR